MGIRGPLPKKAPVRRNKRVYTGRMPVSRPTMPRELTGEARTEWRRIVPELEEAGLLSKVDRALLYRYCLAWADYCDLTDQISKTGRLVRGTRGLIRNPLWLLRSDVESNLAEMMRQLGLTPVARLRIGIEHRPPVPQDKLEQEGRVLIEQKLGQADDPRRLLRALQ